MSTKPITNSSLQAIGLDPARARSQGRSVQRLLPVRVRRLDREDRDPRRQDRGDAQLRRHPGSQPRVRARRAREAAARSRRDPVEKQLGAYYGSCMDEAAIEKHGIKPIKPLLALVAKVKDAKSLGATVIELHAQGMSSTLFDLSPVQDSADARNMIADIDQAGLGLPDRDYYLKDDAQTKKIRERVPRVRHGPARRDRPQARRREDRDARRSGTSRPRSRRSARTTSRAAIRRACTTRSTGPASRRRCRTSSGTRTGRALGLDKVKDVTVTSPDFLAGPRRAARLDEARGLARVPHLPRGRRPRAASCRSRSATARSRSARRSPARRRTRSAGSTARRHRRRARRSARPGLRARPVRRRQQEGGRGAGRRDRRRDDGEPRRARRGWTRRRRCKAAGEAQGDELPDRLSEEVAHLRRSSSIRRRGPRTRSADEPREPGARSFAQDRQARRQGRLADDRADGQRVLRPAAQRHGVPRRHPAAAVLQRRSLDPGEPRRHGRGRRPRADARLRRPGRAVRRRRQPQGLVAARDREAVQGSARSA